MYPEILYFLVPLSFAALYGVVAFKDPQARSLGALLLMATAMLGYNAHPYVRWIWLPIELGMIGLLLLNIRKRRIWNNQAVLACLLFLAMAAASLAVALARGDGNVVGILAAGINVAAVTIAAAFLLADARLSPKHQAALKYFTLAAVFVALSGLVEHLLNASVRVRGIYANANTFAYIVSMGVMTAVHYWRGFIRWVLSAILLVALYYSASRAGFMMVGAFGAWKLWELTRRRRFNLAIVTAVLGLAVLAVAADAIKNRYAPGRSVDAERVIIYRSAKLAFDKHPVAGIGWGQYRYQFKNLGAYRLSTDTFDFDRKRGFFGNREILVTHNDYLSVLIEMGLPAFLVFAWLFFHTLRVALFRASPLKSIAVPLFFGNAIYSLTHNSSNSITFFYFLFLPLAFSGVGLEGVRRRVAAFRRRRALLRGRAQPARAEG